MRKTILLLILWMISVPSFGQDLIITKRGDSIYCKINRIESDIMYYSYQHYDKISSVSMHLSEVRAQYFNYEKVPETILNPILEPDYTRFRIALHGGYSYMIGKLRDEIPFDFRDNYKQLKSGYHLGGSFTYFVNENIGFGLTGTVFKSSLKVDDVYFFNDDGDVVDYGSIQEKLTIPFIAPAFMIRFSDRKNNHAFLISFSLGYLGYINKMKMGSEVIDLKGSTVSFGCALGYDFRLTKNTWLGLQAAILPGSLDSYKAYGRWGEEEIKLGNNENIGRIEVSVGLRFGN